MSSDTHPDAPEIPTLPPPNRAWQVPDGATTVFDDPAPPPALPTLPTLPTLPPAMPAAPPAVAPNPAVGPSPLVHGYGDVPGGMAAVHRASLQQRKRKAPLLHRVVRTVIVLAMLAGVVGAGYFFVQGFRDARRLPAFDTERPAYGTVVIAYEETVDGVTSTGTVTASGDPAVFEIRTDPGSPEPFHLVSDGTTTFGDADGRWANAGPTSDYLAVIESVATLPMFVDFIPTAVRPYVSVADKSDVEIDGVEMERMELLIDDAAFAAADPVASAAWETYIGLEEGPEGTSGARIVITVDDLGIAWRVEYWSDFDSDRSSYRLVSYTDTAFVPVMPVPGTPIAETVPVTGTTTGTTTGDPAAVVPTTAAGCWDTMFCGGTVVPTMPTMPPPPVSVAAPTFPGGTPPPAGG